jgi:glycosyltransferase involved in cell wall biosynthesis
MKLLFITDNCPPEVNAPATRTYEHCREWVRSGVEVTVITCAPNFPQGEVYEGHKNRLISKSYIDGIKVIRVWSYITSNEGFVKRTLDYLSFAVSSFLVGFFIRTDLIVATSPQFFSALSGRWLSFFKRKPWVMEVRDLWPESIKTVGAMEDGFALSFFEWLEKRLYKSARLVICVTDSFKKNIRLKGIDNNKIEVVKNGANLELYCNQPQDKLLKKELGLEDKFVVGYIGTHGLAHKLDFILECASNISDDRIHFLFIGSGAKKADLVEMSNKLNLSNTTFLDSVQKEMVWRYISILDSMVVPLKKSDLFKTVIPSKIFETAAMRKPILLGVDGEVRGMVEDYNAGVFFEPENEVEFMNALTVLVEDKQAYHKYQLGCERLALAFDRKKLADQMLTYLKGCV